MKAFFNSLVVLSLAIFSFGVTLSEMQQDITDVNNSLTTFNTALDAFKASPGIMNTIPLATAAQTMLSIGNRVTKNAQTITAPLSLADATVLAAQGTPVAARVASTLLSIGEAQSQIAAIPMAGGIAIFGVQSLMALFKNNAQKVGDALVAAAPDPAQAAFKSVQDTVDDAFTMVISAFGGQS